MSKYALPAIECHVFARAMGLFDLRSTVTLYDLTNTPEHTPHAS